MQKAPSAENPLDDHLDDSIEVIDQTTMGRLRTLQASLPEPAENVVGELLNHFRRDTARHLEALREHLVPHRFLSQEQCLLCADTFHALKGAASAVGAERVRRGAAIFESQVRTKATPPPPSVLEALEKELAAAIAELERFAATPL